MSMSHTTLMGVWKCCHMWLNAVRKGLRLRSIDRFCPLMQTAIDWLQVKMLNLWCPVLAIIHKIRTTFCSFQWIPYIESFQCHIKWHKKNHNLSMWWVVVGGGVIMGHPSTNHNSPHERVVAFFVPLYMAQDFPHMYVWMQCLIIDREKNRIVDDMFFSISIAIN